MKRNVGRTDRMIRVTLGTFLVLYGVLYDSWWGLLGIMPLVTGLLGYCPPYELFKINTYKKK